jgi:hypothetical protein
MRNTKRRSVVVELSGQSRTREVEREIKTFLNALNSYPDRFAREPYLSFEQHLFSIAAAAEAGRERHRG